MKWFVADFFFGVWIVPFLLTLIVVVALAARPDGGWRTITDTSGKYEARMAEAQAREAEARAAEARGAAIGEAHKAWAGNLPLILLVAGGIASVVMTSYWRGRNQHEFIRQTGVVQRAQIEATESTPQPVNPQLTVNILSENMLAMLEHYATAQGKQLQTDGVDYYLIDNSTGEAQRVKPKGILNG